MKSFKRKLFAGVMVLLASTVIVLVFSGHMLSQQADTTGEGIEPVSTAPETAESSDESDALQESLGKLLAGNEQVLAQLDRLDQRLSTLEMERDEKANESYQKQKAKAALARASKDPKLVAKFNQTLASSRDKHYQTISDNFETEPVDSEWAEATKERVLSGFDQSNEINAWLDEVTCRTSLCRIVLDIPSSAAILEQPGGLMNLEVDLMSKLSSGDGAIQSFTRTEPDGLGGMRYITYAARSGYDLPPASSPFEGMTIEESIEYLKNEP
jgi:hypothetical protein